MNEYGNILLVPPVKNKIDTEYNFGSVEI